MKVCGVFSILVCMSILSASNVAIGANNLMFYLSLDDEISITSSGGEMVDGPGVFVEGEVDAAFGGNGSVYGRWDDADVGGLFEGWDDEAGFTVDLYFSGDHWNSHSGDSGLWTIVRRASDRYIILSVQNGKMRHLFRDGDSSREFKYHITDVGLSNNVTYRLTVRQANGEFDVYLNGGVYRNESPVFSADNLPEDLTWAFVPGGGNPPREMNVGRRAIFGGNLQSGEWVDEIRVYNGFYSPGQLDTPFARDLFPADDAENVPAEPFLSWDVPESRLMKEEPASYNVYFGTEEPNELNPNVDFELVSEGKVDTFCIPLDEGVLEMLTDYYWRVDVVDPNNGWPIVYKGDLMHFTTIPPKATGPFPIDGATGVAQNVVLSWNSGYGADEHDIYLDPNELLVAAGDDSVSLPRQSGTSYVCDLAWETEYFWRVDEVFAGEGEPVAGDVWSFLTGSPECEYELGGDVNDDCAVNFDDFAIMAADWMECNLINGNCD